MTTPALTAILPPFSEFMAKKFGLFFPPEKYSDLEREILSITRAAHFPDPATCATWLMKMPVTNEQLTLLTRYFTIGETYFFREHLSFEALQTKVLPKLIESRLDGDRTLRIWSAGCSSGEEAYSIAMLLSELIWDIQSWNITVLASDICVDMLKRLREGVYTEWSFREISPEMRKKYFKKIGNNQYLIAKDIQKMVTSINLNLEEDIFPSLSNNTSNMDIIFCRNVLMYFIPENAKRIIRKFHQALTNNGYLLLSSNEYSIMQDECFKSTNFSGTFFYKKLEEAPDRTALFLSQDSGYEESIYEEPIWTPPTKFFDLEPTEQTEPVLDSPPPQTVLDLPTPRAIEAVAQSLADQGKLAEALSLIQEEIVSDKCNANLHYIQALILQELGQIPEAISALKKAIYLSPDFVLSYFSLGNIAYTQGQIKTAKKNFSIVLSLIDRYDPQDILPGSESLTAKKMVEIIQKTHIISGGD